MDQTGKIMILEIWMDYGPVAQLGARLNGIEKAESSNLSGSTKDSRKAVFV